MKESIRTKNSQLGEIEIDRLMEYSKGIQVKKIPKHNEKQNLKFKTNVQIIF